MKKTVLLLSMIFIISLAVNAQITINQSNTPAIGYVVTQAQDTVYAEKTLGGAGANQTWNFTDWVNHTQSTLTGLNPSTQTGASNFPSANIGFDDGIGDMMFANSSSTSLIELGAYGDFSGLGAMALTYNPYYKLISFPSTYNTSYSGTYSYSIAIPYTQSPPIDSVKVNSTVAYSSVIDAWGTISTPQYSNVPCIRQKVREISTQNMYVHMGTWISTGAPTIDTTYSYSWWSDTHNYSIASMGTDSVGNITSISWLVSYLPSSAGITENTVKKNELKVYPNPASINTTLTYTPLNTEGEIDVYNLLGQIVYKENVAKGSTQTVLNIQNYKSGIFKIVIKENGIVKAQESFIKQ